MHGVLENVCVLEYWAAAMCFELLAISRFTQFTELDRIKVGCCL